MSTMLNMKVAEIVVIRLNASSKLESGRASLFTKSWLVVLKVCSRVIMNLAIEILIQLGRYDFEVNPETVDFNIQRQLPRVDPSDHEISRQYTYFTRMVKMVRTLNGIYGKVKKQKDWGSNPQFTTLNPMVQDWLEDLPNDLQVNFPEGGTPPWLPNHFVGNMHAYHHLIVIMLHRPQLMSSQSFSAGGSWKKHMMLSYASAKAMCRLQEGVIQSFGLAGLRCMLRGINFVIYAVLTCTMIHLVSFFMLIVSHFPANFLQGCNYLTRP